MTQQKNDQQAMSKKTISSRRKRGTAARKAAESAPKASQAVQLRAQTLNLSQIKLPQMQPRRYFDEEKMEQLTASVKEYGILEPLIVRPLSIDEGNQYELVAGERRKRAAEAAGLTEVPVTIHELNDQQAQEIALLENLQRNDLNPIEETEGLLNLLCQSLGATENEVEELLNRAANAKRLGKELNNNDIIRIEKVDKLFAEVGRLSREGFRANRLPLRKLPEDILNVLREGQLEYTKGRAISLISDEEARGQLLQEAIAGMSLKEVKSRVRELRMRRGRKAPSRNITAELRKLAQVPPEYWTGSKHSKVLKLIEEINQILDA